MCLVVEPCQQKLTEGIFSFISYKRSNRYRTVILLRGCYLMIVHTCGVLIQTKNSPLRKTFFIDAKSFACRVNACSQSTVCIQSKQMSPPSHLVYARGAGVSCQPTQLTSQQVITPPLLWFQRHFKNSCFIVSCNLWQPDWHDPLKHLFRCCLPPATDWLWHHFNSSFYTAVIKKKKKKTKW